MKKYILASVITAFVATFTAQAQENTYNMVIKMANGTTITIGPNEIENIVFNDGAVTVSGKRIDDFVSSLDLLEKKTETLTSKADLVAAITDLEAKINEVGTAKNSEIRAEIDALKQEIANLNTSDIIAMINVLQMQIKSLTDEVAALKNDGSNNDNQGGGKDDDSSSSATNSQLVGVWHQYINGYIIGFCFYADGTGW